MGHYRELSYKKENIGGLSVILVVQYKTAVINLNSCICKEHIVCKVLVTKYLSDWRSVKYFRIVI